MPLAPIKNILRFSHNKWDKHLISSKKDLSQVPMFVSHNGISKIVTKPFGIFIVHPYSHGKFGKLIEDQVLINNHMGVRPPKKLATMVLYLALESTLCPIYMRKLGFKPNWRHFRA